MSKALVDVLRRLRSAALARDSAGLTDGQLLERFRSHGEEAAFEALVRRHGPMVLGVCRRVLGDLHDAEDCFQATFLVLVRRADAVSPPEQVGNWLHGVAQRTALRARSAGARRRVKERSHSPPSERPDAYDGWRDLLPVLDEELGRLPEKYRLPVVLCDLEGRAYREAAQLLGWPEGTLAGRLSRARARLAQRLTRRGVALSAASLAALLARDATAAVPPSLFARTVTAALALTAGPTAVTASPYALTFAVGLLLVAAFGLVANVLAEPRPTPVAVVEADPAPRTLVFVRGEVTIRGEGGRADERKELAEAEAVRRLAAFFPGAEARGRQAEEWPAAAVVLLESDGGERVRLEVDPRFAQWRGPDGVEAKVKVGLQDFLDELFRPEREERAVALANRLGGQAEREERHGGPVVVGIQCGDSLIRDEDLPLIGCLTGLKSLDLRCCRDLSDVGLAHLRRLTLLETLAGIDDTRQITDAGLAHLAGMRRLRRLSLRGCAVTPKGLEVLWNMPDLESLDLRDTDVGDEGLAKLVPLANLRELDLGARGVSEQGLQQLRELANLEVVRVEGVPINLRGPRAAADTSAATLPRTRSIEYGRRCRSDPPPE